MSANPIGAVAVSHCPLCHRWRCPIDPAGRPFDVFNGEVARTVDLNADLGERESVTEVDRGVIDAVTSVSIACGFHAGSPTVIRDVARICRDHGVAIGAHMSYRDRAGFGRRAMHVEADQLLADILEQCDALAMAASGVGADVAYVKPHGALYNAMATDDEAAAAVVEAVAAQSHTVLVAQAHTTVVRLADAAGVRTIYEGFPDRGYLSDGRLALGTLPRRSSTIPRRPERVLARSCSTAASSPSTATGRRSSSTHSACTATPRMPIV